MRICDTNNSADKKVSKEEGGVVPGIIAEIPQQALVKVW